jgi:hypothetical protein
MLNKFMYRDDEKEIMNFEETINLIANLDFKTYLPKELCIYADYDVKPLPLHKRSDESLEEALKTFLTRNSLLRNQKMIILISLVIKIAFPS